MVYVQRADGAEYLFLGDVAWYLVNVERVRERPRVMTAAMGEDREAVLNQLGAIHQLSSEAPQVHVVPGHDPKVIARLVASGALVQGFQEPTR
jgi:hypothetical protein